MENKRLQTIINDLSKQEQLARLNAEIKNEGLLDGFIEKHEVSPIQNFDKVFELKCNEEFDLFEGIFTADQVVYFFICMTVVYGGFNYVIKDAARNKFGYLINGKFLNDINGNKAKSIITYLIFRALHNDISEGKPRKLTTAEDENRHIMEESFKFKEAMESISRITHFLKEKLPNRIDLKNESYRRDYTRKYTLSKFTRVVCEETGCEEIDF